MSEKAPLDRDACAAIRELVAWHAAGALDPADVRSVEDHLSGCAACSALFSFARDLKTGLAEVGESHPRSEQLVAFAEGRGDLPEHNRAAMERHLGECETCAQLCAILDAVDEPDADARREERQAQQAGWLRSLWGSLCGSILRPVPAAVYLTIAAVAVVLLLARLGERPGDIPPMGDAPRIAPVAGVILLLPDWTEIGRGGDPSSEEVPVIWTGTTRILLLEFLDLPETPAPDVLYKVRITQKGKEDPAWQTDFAGSDLAETLSLGIFVEAETLAPGHYEITLTGPAGSCLYRSGLEVR